MSFSARSIPSRLPPGASASSSSGSSPALVARIEEKKAELENLKQLRDLSAAVATQMEALEQQLSTLSDGTEAIAMVIGNWHNVLRAISMASAKLPKPQEEARDDGAAATPLPQTLVRIPTEHAPSLQAQAEQAEQEAENQA